MAKVIKAVMAMVLSSPPAPGADGLFLLSISVAVINHSDQRPWGEKNLFVYGKSRQEFEEETNRGLLLTGSLPGSAFFLLPRPRARLTVDWALHHQLVNTISHRHAHRPTNGGSSSAEFPFPGCVR